MNKCRSPVVGWGRSASVGWGGTGSVGSLQTSWCLERWQPEMRRTASQGRCQDPSTSTMWDKVSVYLLCVHLYVHCLPPPPSYFYLPPQSVCVCACWLHVLWRYLQWGSQVDLLSIVTEDAPSSTEKDETDPLLRLDNCPLDTRGGWEFPSVDSGMSGSQQVINRASSRGRCQRVSLEVLDTWRSRRDMDKLHMKLWQNYEWFCRNRWARRVEQALGCRGLQLRPDLCLCMCDRFAHLLLQESSVFQSAQKHVPPLPVGGADTCLRGAMRFLPHQHKICPKDSRHRHVVKNCWLSIPVGATALLLLV